jgi:hypothetical protein
MCHEKIGKNEERGERRWGEDEETRCLSTKVLLSYQEI